MVFLSSSYYKKKQRLNLINIYLFYKTKSCNNTDTMARLVIKILDNANKHKRKEQKE